MPPLTRQSGHARPTPPKANSPSTSRALEWLWNHLRDVPRPAILDCGPARQTTVDVLLRRRAKLFIADLISPLQASESALWNRSGKTPAFRTEMFLTLFPAIAADSLAAVFSWHLLDLLPHAALQPVVARLWSCLSPGGVLLCLLREPYLPAGADAIWRMENLTTLSPEHEGTKPFPYPALTNREVERLVAPGSVKTFLTRSGRREVLAIK